MKKLKKLIILLLLCSLNVSAQNYYMTDKGIRYGNSVQDSEAVQIILPDTVVPFRLDSLATDYIKRAGKELRFNAKRYVKQSKHYAKLIQQASDKWGIPVAIIEAVIQVESRWYSKAKGIANCNGLMQVQGGVFDVARNINSGTGILAHRLKQCKGDMAMALTAYNRGLGGARKYYRKHGHCSNYATRVLRLAEKFQMYIIIDNCQLTINNYEKINLKLKTYNLKLPQGRLEEKMTDAEKETKRRAEIMLATKFDENGCAVNLEYMEHRRGGWYKITCPNWQWDYHDYRIIPEPAKPEYVPYDFSDAEEILGMKVKPIFNEHFVSVICALSKDGRVAHTYIDSGGCHNGSICTGELLERFTKLDGTPCGKLKT